MEQFKTAFFEFVGDSWEIVRPIAIAAVVIGAFGLFQWILG